MDTHLIQLLRQDYYKEDFHAFNEKCLNYRDMNQEHDSLISFLLTPKKYKLILMPRFTFKSCICTIGYPLWRLAKDPNFRILIYSDAATKAEGFLTGIKGHITGEISGSIFREVFGAWEVDPKKDKWNASQIVIKVRTTKHNEPSIDTGGIETSKIGFHYDLIIFDDIVSDLNTTTKSQMDKTAECYKKALSLLKPGGEIIIVGTRWNFGDLYGRLVAENEGLFDTFIKKAHEGPKYFFADIGENSLTKERLDLLRSQQGSYVFSCLYQNNPVDDETAIFKSRDFSFQEVSPEDLYITGTIDPAGEGEDFTAIVVIGTDNRMNMYLLEIVNRHLLPSQIVSEVVRLHYKYKLKQLGVETNFFRGTLKSDLEAKRNEEHADNPTRFPSFGIEEFKATRGERTHEHIMALQPKHEAGQIIFPGKRLELLNDPFSVLADQMLKYTIDGAKSPHDDILVALSLQLPLIRKGGVVKKKEIPWSSPAWFELEQYKKEISRNHRLPRRRRQFIAPLTFS